MSKDESGEGEVEDGANLVVPWASELIVDPVLHSPYNDTGEHKESTTHQPQIRRQWFKENPSALAVLIHDWDHHSDVRDGVRKGEVHVLGSVGRDRHVPHHGIIPLRKPMAIPPPFVLDRSP